MSRRRTRFTVTYSPDVSDEVEKVVVLAYSAPGAMQTVRELRRPCIIHGVETGDYRDKKILAEISGDGWVLDSDKLAEAIDLLGLKWDVEIKQHGRKSMTSATHAINYRDTYIRNGRIYGLDEATAPFHKIMVKRYLSPERASQSLWHELTHAMQAEHAVIEAGAVTCREIHNAWNAVLESKNGGITYFKKPIEVEAREFESFANDCPIAAPRR